MKKFLESLQKPSRLIYLIGSLVFGGLLLVIQIGSIGGGFLSVMGSILWMIALVSLMVAAPIMLLLKKDAVAKVIFMMASAFMLIFSMRDQLSFADWTEVEDGLVVTIGVFAFLVGLLSTAIIVLMILSIALKANILKLISMLLLAILFLFAFVLTILFIVYLAKNESKAWEMYLYQFVNLIAPCVLLFGYLFFFGVPEVEGKQAAPKQEEAPAEEAPAEEQPQE